MNITKQMAIAFSSAGILAGAIGAIALQTHAQSTATTTATSPAVTASGIAAQTAPPATITQTQAEATALSGKNGVTVTKDELRPFGNRSEYEIVLSDGSEVKVSATSGQVTHTEDAAREAQEQAGGDPAGPFGHGPNQPDQNSGTANGTSSTQVQ